MGIQTNWVLQPASRLRRQANAPCRFARCLGQEVRRLLRPRACPVFASVRFSSKIILYRRAARRLQRRVGPFYEARVFFASAKADSSISTLSRTTRSTHFSNPLSRCSFARNAARAASSAGSDSDLDFERRIETALSQAESCSKATADSLNLKRTSS